jgi:23S rRNA (adenine1618-N6)-methyltransferase
MSADDVAAMSASGAKRKQPSSLSDEDATDVGGKMACNPAAAEELQSLASGYASLHERNPYLNRPPDFAALAAAHDFLAPYVFFTATGAASIDWRRPEALLALTRALLLADFGVAFDMPLNHLCPPVPQRLNYLLWVEDLLALSGLSSSQYRLRGVDIGCGASLIFPLLGAAHFGWSFVATDIDAESVESARANIARNAPYMPALIEVRHVADRARLLCGVLNDDESFEFCVCNPPFFESLADTGLNRRRAAQATAGELTCPGGELAFVSRLLDDSVVLRHRVRWFTTMLGRKASLDALRRRLALMATDAQFGITCVRHCEFVQGKQTRWGLAWSFDPAVPSALLPAVAVRDRFTLIVSAAPANVSPDAVADSAGRRGATSHAALAPPLSAADALGAVAAAMRRYGAQRVNVDVSRYRIEAVCRAEAEPSSASTPPPPALTTGDATSDSAATVGSEEAATATLENASGSNTASESASPSAATCATVSVAAATAAVAATTSTVLPPILWACTVQLAAAPNREFELAFARTDGEASAFTRMVQWARATLLAETFRSVRSM